MAKEEKKAPKLRFNGYTNDWERKKLGDVAEKVIQKNNNNAFKNVLTNSAEYGIISQRDFFERNIANKNNISTYYIVQNDDFVYNPRISNLAPYGPINRNKTGYTGIISPLYYVFRVLNINTAFIEWYFKTTCWHKFMYQHGDSGARSDRFSIKDNELKKLPIKLPVDDMEQEKIAKTLTSLDNTLQLHERKYEELTIIKQALLQKLFPKKDEIKPEVRYENFSDAWEQRKLGEVVNLRGRIGFRGYKQTDLVDKGQGAISFSPADIDEFGNVLNCNNKYISWAKYDESPEIQIAQGDILFTKTASIGKIGYITKLREKATINPQIALITPLKNENGYFIFLSLRLDQFTKKVRNIIGGSSVPTLSQEKLKLLTFMYPDTSEQKEIGDFFKQLDSLIALHQCKLEKLKQLKKFLLQNMFI